MRLDSASTLPLGAESIPDPEMASPTRNLVDFVFGGAGIPAGVVTDEDVAQFKPKIIDWIRSNTLCLETMDAKCADDVERIDVTLGTIRIAQGELDQLHEEFRHHSEKIHKARATMVSKWRSGSIAYGSTSGPNPLEVKIKQLNDWALSKLTDARKPVTNKETFIMNLDKKLDGGIMSLIRRLKGPEDCDPECDLLLKELEEKFDDLHVEPLEPPVSASNAHSALEMTAPTLSLQKCMELKDGPGKKALLADLEAAVANTEAHLVTKTLN